MRKACWINWLSAPGDTITLERAQLVLGTAANVSILALTDAWLNANGAEGLGIIHEALVSGADARQFCRQMVNHLRTLLLLQAAGLELAVDVPDEYKGEMLAQAQRAPRPDLIKAIKRFQEAALKPIASWQPQLPLELAFMELLPDTPLAVYAAVDARAPRELPRVKEAAAVPIATPAAPEPAATAPPVAAEKKDESAEVEAVDEEVVIEQEKTAAATAEPSASITLNGVKAQWRTMVAQVGQIEKNLPALLAMCKPLAVEGQTVVLGFDYPIFKEKFDRTEHASAVIEDAFSELLGTKCSVRCVVTSDYAMPIGREEFQELAEELGGILEEES